MKVVQSVSLVCLLLFSFSCSKQPGAKSDGAPAPATAANSSSSSSSSPKDTFRANYDALKRKDIAAFKKTFSKRWLKVAEEMSKMDNRPLDDFLRDEVMTETGAELLPETAREEIDGERARLEVRDKEGSAPHVYKLVKEDGEWKLDSY